jgi:hypothetical protein
MQLRKRVVVKVITFLVSVPVLSSAASAQMWQGGAGFQLGFPTGEYNDQVNTTAVGLSGDFLYSPHQSPFGIGITLGWFQVGREERQEPFSTTIPDVTVDVTTEHNLAQLMLLLRLQPKSGPILPYGDGLVGLNYLYTKTRIANTSSGEEVASSTNSDDNAFAYGFGGGLMIKVYDRQSEENSKPVQVFIDLNARYILGGDADYLKEGSIRREDGEVIYDITRSKTNIAVARLGVTVNL